MKLIKILWYAVVAAALVNGAIDLIYQILMIGVE